MGIHLILLGFSNDARPPETKLNKNKELENGMIWHIKTVFAGRHLFDCSDAHLHVA